MTFIHAELTRTSGHIVDYLCEEDVPARWNGKLSRFSFPLLVLREARRAAARGEAYDVVNVHEPSSAAIALLKGRAGNPRVVVTSYGIERRAWELAREELRLEREGPSLKTRFVYPPTSLWQSALGLRLADHVICSNEEDKEYLINCLKVPPHGITRMHSAASTMFAESALGRSYERCESLLFAATWRKNKGIEDLVPAFNALAARYSDLKLTVLGGGLPEETILRMFPEAVRDRVICVKAKTDEDTAACFARADIFILPSLFEGTPLTLLEAMMSGLPIVTTNTCGMKDVIQHDRNGLLIPIRSPQALEAAVERLMQDAALRARVGLEAQAEALKKYTWEQVASPIGAVYQKLCER